MMRVCSSTGLPRDSGLGTRDSQQRKFFCKCRVPSPSPESLLSLSLILAFVSSFSFPYIASAQDLTTPACVRETYGSLASAQRKFRSVVLGQKEASDLPVGSIRYDSAGTAWTKMAANQWDSNDAQEPAMADAEMDGEAEFPAVKGVLETRKTLTSDLLPPLLQAFRAFTYDTRARCLVALASQRRDAPATITVQPIGGIEFTYPRMDGCRIEQPAVSAGGEKNAAHFGEVKTGFCDNVRTALVEHEAKALKFLVAYDASYRSLLQFTGSFQNFMTQLRGPLLFPLWEAYRAMQVFGDQQCFTAQCDE